MNSPEEAAAVPPSVLKIGWVLWWPTPYFVDRFNALTHWPGVDFEALFVAPSSSHQAWKMDPSTWAFRYTIIKTRPTKVGYSRPGTSLVPAWSILRSSSDRRIVMPYADASAILVASIARLTGRRYYLFAASTDDDARGQRRVSELLKRYMFRGAQASLATGPLQQKYACQYAGPKGQVAVIGNPIDTSYLRMRAPSMRSARNATRQARGWRNDFVISYVGRFAPEKGLEVLVRAARTLTDCGVSTRLALAGAGPSEFEIRALVRELAVRADFLGFLRPDELCELYSAADVFVLPSFSEPWGLVVNEAMEFSLPVVVSDHVGSRHLVEHGATGFVFHSGDIAELARILLALSDNTSLRETVGAGGHQRIKDETIENWVHSVVEALRSFS